MRRHHISFKHALDGIMYVFKSQPNFRVHFVAAFLVLFISLAFRITRIEAVVLLFTVSLVMVAEMVNTAIEAMTDLLTLKYNEYAKTAKDVAAGMVLVSAGFAVVTGVLILGPYFYSLITSG